MQPEVTDSTFTQVPADDAVARAATAAFAQRLLDWANSEAGARTIWQAWLDGMRDQSRDVSIYRQSWVGLDSRDRKLDHSIAVQFAKAAIQHAIGESNA